MGILLYVILAVAYAWAVVDLARQARVERGRGGTQPRGELVVLRPAEGRTRPMAPPTP